jgi:hypothetical protein
LRFNYGHYSYLVVDSRDFAPQDVHMGLFAVGADFLVAMHAQRAIRLFRAHVAPLHDLIAVGVRKFSGDLDVQLEESLQGDVGREALHALIGNAMLGSTFRALDLRTYAQISQIELSR